MKMKGTLNISLNAVDPSICAGEWVDRLSVVLSNIERFMTLRRGHEDSWSVIASSVVLEDTVRCPDL